MAIESSRSRKRHFWSMRKSMKSNVWTKPGRDRRCFIGGSDARIIMGDDEAALNRLWREKRGEIEPEDLSGNLIVQLGVATGAVFEAKFMLPWSFSEEAAAEKYMPQLQHNMWVIAARSAVLSVITGG